MLCYWTGNFKIRAELSHKQCTEYFLLNVFYSLSLHWPSRSWSSWSWSTQTKLKAHNEKSADSPFVLRAPLARSAPSKGCPSTAKRSLSVSISLRTVNEADSVTRHYSRVYSTDNTACEFNCCNMARLLYPVSHVPDGTSGCVNIYVNMDKIWTKGRF